VRVTGGKWCNQNFDAPKNSDTTRPTSDFDREQVFNILVNGFKHKTKNFIDFFSGSGSFAWESFSRGASKGLLIEANNKAIQTIIKNASKFNVLTEMQIIRSKDIPSWAMEINKKNIEFNTFFCDPPYDSYQMPTFIKVIDANNRFTANESMLVIQRGQKESEIALNHWDLVKSKQKGHSLLLFYKYKG